MPAFYTDRSDRGLLRLTGRDRQTFLQGMITNDVMRLSPGQGCYTFLLDATAHVLSDARVLCLDNSLLLDVEPGQATFVKETLEKYLIMERCRITDISMEMSQCAIWGHDAARAIKNAFGIDLPADAAEGTNATQTTQDGATVAADRLLQLPCFNLYVPNLRNLDVTYLAGLKREGVQETTTNTLEAYRIEAGTPRFGVDIDARVLAPETAQQGRAISYKKGCYIGQEIVARIDARGHTNRTLVGFHLPQGEPLPALNTALVAHDGRDVGRITSSGVGPTVHRPIALGYVRREHGEIGTRLRLASSENSAEVAALPFVDGV